MALPHSTHHNFWTKGRISILFSDHVDFESAIRFVKKLIEKLIFLILSKKFKIIKNTNFLTFERKVGFEFCFQIRIQYGRKRILFPSRLLRESRKTILESPLRSYSRNIYQTHGQDMALPHSTHHYFWTKDRISILFSDHVDFESVIRFVKKLIEKLIFLI